MKHASAITTMKALGAFCLGIIFFLGCTNKAREIVVREFTMQWTGDNPVFQEEVLPGEIAGTRVEHVAYAGPISEPVELTGGYTHIFLFIKGNGTLSADTLRFSLEPETIAIPFAFGSVNIEVGENDTLHLLHFIKELTPEDLEDMNSFPAGNKYDIYFTRFSDCEAYTEKIKSPNTVSRTVLPADIIPRVSLGTVETKGPDAVGAHEHAMLDQLFLGLTGNDVTVHADDLTTRFTEYSLLHIPIGSSHWVTVDEHKIMYYMWMDFFLTREGQEWLKTHKPISKDMRSEEEK
jgi:quercetin dioxygenase-like cupin family protein